MLSKIKLQCQVAWRAVDMVGGTVVLRRPQCPEVAWRAVEQDQDNRNWLSVVGGLVVLTRLQCPEVAWRAVDQE